MQGITLADVNEEFKLAIKIRDQTSRANEAVIRIREIKSKIAKEAPSEANKALLKQLSEIEENLYQVKNQSGQDPLNFPIKLNNRLAALERSVETGDAKPTASSYQVFKELSAELDRQLAELNALLHNKKVNSSLINGPAR